MTDVYQDKGAMGVHKIYNTGQERKYLLKKFFGKETLVELEDLMLIIKEPSYTVVLIW